MRLKGRDEERMFSVLLFSLLVSPLAAQRVCDKKDFIDIVETDVPEKERFRAGERCIPKQPCSQVKDLSVIFLVDSSESIQEANWKSLVQFLRTAADQLPTSANVGFVKFSDKVTFSDVLKGGWTKKQFEDFVPTQFDASTTNTPAALDKARELFLKDNSKNKVAVLITDGFPYMDTIPSFEEAMKLTREAADKLREANASLVVLGYGGLGREFDRIRNWVKHEDDLFAYDKAASNLKETHMSILLNKVCQRFA